MNQSRNPFTSKLAITGYLEPEEQKLIHLLNERWAGLLQHPKIPFNTNAVVRFHETPKKGRLDLTIAVLEVSGAKINRTSVHRYLRGRFQHSHKGKLRRTHSVAVKEVFSELKLTGLYPTSPGILVAKEDGPVNLEVSFGYTKAD